MPFNGSGIFSLVAGNPVITGTVISSTVQNNTMSDIANNGLTNCLTKDGQQTPTANIPLGGFKITNLGNGTALTDAATVGQVQNSGASILGSISGTGDAIIAASAPAITAYTVGQAFIYTPTSANTLTNPTINISSVGAKTITQSNGIGLWAGALVVGTPYVLLYDGTNFRIQSGQLGAQIVPMGSPFSYRNRFIDGGFDFWDTGTSTAATAGGNYVSSMWGYACGTSGAATCSQGTFAPGAEPAGMTTPARSFMQIAQTVGGSTAPAVFQRIESVATFEGRSATLSVWLWVNSGTLSLSSVSINQNFGSGGSAPVITSYSVPWTLTTTPTRFSVRLDVPSISGKTIGTSDSLNILISFPVSTIFTVNVGQAQIEDCPAGAPAAGLPTPYERPSPAIMRSMISRFLNLVTCSLRFPASAGAQLIDTTITYPPMRASPAATLITAGSATNLAAQTTSSLTANSSRFEISSTAAGDCFALVYLYLFDARI